MPSPRAIANEQRALTVAKILGALRTLLRHAAPDEIDRLPMMCSCMRNNIVPAVSKILIEFFDEQDESVFEFSAKAPVSGEMLHLDFTVRNVLQKLMRGQAVFFAERQIVIKHLPVKVGKAGISAARSVVTLMRPVAKIMGAAAFAHGTWIFERIERHGFLATQ